MAINPETQYPGKIAPSTPDYPYGAARNVTVPGDGTGTPWEAALVKDIMGLQQALLSAASIVPSGSPDTAGNSQYFDAIAKVAGKNSGVVFATKADLEANTPIGGKAITLEPGMAVHTLCFNTANDGGGAAYVIESGTSGVNGLDVIQVPGSNKATRIPGQFEFSCGWIWDDGYANHKNVVVPLFESKGAYCAFAPHTVVIDGADRLTSTDILDLNARGYEFINHSYSHITMGNDRSNQAIKAEVDTAWSFFETLGVHIGSFLTPSSVLGSNHLEIIRQRYGFAYTQGTSFVGMRGVKPHELRRVAMETYTTEQCKSAMDDILVFGGSVIFYAHDVINGDVIYNRTSDLLDYAAEIGVPVELPTASVKKGVIGWQSAGSKFLKGRTIYNRRNAWQASNGATVSVDGNLDILVTAASPGQSLIETVFVTNLEDLGAITFSSAFRSTIGTLGASNFVGLKVADESNTTTLYQIEESIGLLPSGDYRRYNISGQSYSSPVAVTLYFRADFANAGDQVLLRDPILRYGTDVTPDVKSEINKSFEVNIPAQTVTAGGYTENNILSLTDQSDNGLFLISGDRLRFRKSTRVEVSVSVVAYGTNSLQGSLGGGLFLDYGTGKLQSSISAGVHTGGGEITTTLDVDPNTNISLALFNVGADFPVSASDFASKIFIREAF